ncbi:Holliday junction resolvase RuvX [Prochlorococcus marinus]|uniref:Putative pre-16S rRNA nuclease n=1 Tax=Prochlorococcus marinus (strain MIT 9211) TaxID=93059 RepID=YQGF_PROM4|nr:Holliday junction resolvase RuvX [Prochlorococcus marinus]A9BAN9.1 RecName: Full=Putative pre-16S rRNA nuclease [Prochlorococcus marinus str. MIT 9211]ABX08901.1 Predicted endonuclease involved in recombination [Prochlorococcus marinus str. MIT 9211]
MLPAISKSVLSLDVGKRRIGIAGCDPLGITITQLEAIKRTTFNNEATQLRQLCDLRDVRGIIIGLPLSDLGKETKQSSYCYTYGINIAKELNLPLAWVNEHSSTWEAGQRFKLQNDRSGKLDSAAAALLLEQWLTEGPELEFLKN